MRVFHFAAALAACTALSGCVTAGNDVVRFQSKTPQQFVAMRDGESVITSRGRYSTVTLKPGMRQIGSRPVFVVGIQNISQRPLDFVVGEIVAVQAVGPEEKQLKVYSYNELVEEENTAQVGRGILVAALGGVGAGLAGRNQYAQDRAAEQNAVLAAQVAAAGQQNLYALEQLTIKDQTVMPGEMYAGKLFIEGPVESGTTAAKLYTLTIKVGPDRHQIHITQGPA